MRNCNNSYHLHLAVVAVCTLLYLVLEKLSRFTKYELKKKIKTNQMKINTLYNK